jgi:heptosyltransferase-3
VIHPKKILVIKFRNIGDVLLTSPLISTLKNGVPDANIYAAVKAGTEAMLEGHPDLEKLYVLPKKNHSESTAHFLIRYLRWLQQLRKEKFDLALNTTEGDRGIVLSFLIGAKERWCELKPQEQRAWKKTLLTKILTPPKSELHTVQRNIHLAKEISTENQYRVFLYTSDNDHMTVRRLLTEHGWSKNKKLIHIHPTSRWFFKCLPNITVTEIINRLMKEDHQVVLTCAPESREITQLSEIVAKCAIQPINLGGKLTLKQTGALSKIADLFFGVDSAPMHMAAAMAKQLDFRTKPLPLKEWRPEQPTPCSRSKTMDLRTLRKRRLRRTKEKRLP